MVFFSYQAPATLTGCSATMTAGMVILSFHSIRFGSGADGSSATTH